MESDTSPDDTPNVDLLNIDISLEDVQQAVAQAKLRKAPGIDLLPAEALKHPTCINLLNKLVNYGFESGTVSSLWKRGVINPIPKCSSKDPRVP